jgi:hypothetical protein
MDQMAKSESWAKCLIDIGNAATKMRVQDFQA